MFEIGWLDDDKRDEGEFARHKSNAHWQLEWLCMCVL